MLIEEQGASGDTRGREGLARVRHETSLRAWLRLSGAARRAAPAQRSEPRDCCAAS
jgi:hypothetical protein